MEFPDDFVEAINNISGDTTSWEIIIPEQTITVSSSYTQVQFNKPLVAGEEYICTVNGTTKTLTAADQWGSIFVLFSNDFYFDYSDPSMFVDVSGSSQYGTYTVKVEKVTSSCGGGLEYEEGTYTPASDVAEPSISFVNVHNEPPVLVCLSDSSNSYDDTTNTNYLFVYTDFGKIANSPIYSASTAQHYVAILYRYRGTSSTSTSYASQTLSISSTDTTDTANGYPRYWVNESRFKPSSNSASRYWRSGRTYKWIAVWAPTT